MRRIPCLLATAWLLLCCACAAPAPQEPGGAQSLVVGVVDHLSESSWRDRVAASIEEAAEEAGVQLITLQTERTQYAQIQAIRTLITYQVDAIVFSPLTQRGFDSVLKEAEEAGIPVVLVHRKVLTENGAAASGYVGSDYEQQGRLAAENLLRRFQWDEDIVQIMELHDTVGSSATVERSRGIRAVFGRNIKYDIFYTVSCNSMYSKARELMAIHLNSGRRPGALISYSDGMTMGAITAIEEAGLLPGTDIYIISFDAQQDAMTLLAEGKINCLVETDPNVGAAVMETAAILARGEAEHHEVILESQVFTTASVAEELQQRGY